MKPIFSLTFGIFLVSSLALMAATPLKLEKLRPQKEAAEGATPFYQFSSEAIGLTVPNVHDDPRMWGELFRELTLGALETGIAVADFDKDRRLDIYAVSKNGPNALYLQLVDYRFMDIAKTAGVAADDTTDGKAGATAVDINQDGWMDIYLCRYDAPNLLFVNNGDATFTERGAEYGLDINDASVHAGFADYDLDGDLDCYLVTNILRFSINPRGRADYLLRNNGDGTFSDVSSEAGIWGTTQGHTAIWFDSNHDGWPDLYVANDFETPDRFYLNQGDGTFVDVVDEQLPHVTYFSMGADSGDLNNDGLVDYFVADMRDRTREEYMSGMEEMGRGLWEMERVTELVPQYMWNALYLNSGTDHFKEMAFMAGMEATGWTWATRMADFDCDGFLDVFFTNGMIRNFIDADLVDRQKVVSSLEGRAAVWKNAPMRNEPNVAYHNQGDLSFKDVSKEWGLDHVGISFGCVTADMDGDGDLDLVYSNYNAPPTLMRNDFTRGNRLAIRLEGRAPNRRAIGAEITLESPEGIQTRQLFTERGIVSSEPAIAYFGLGEDPQADKVTIRWPGGEVSTLENLPAGYLVTVSHPGGDEPVKPVERPEPLFNEVAEAAGLDYQAELIRIDELSTQRLLPRRLNGQGPDLAQGDVNGDGLADVFVTGSTGTAGRLYLGQENGSFAPAAHQPWESAAEADDPGAVFIDVNGDGHLDLYIAAGGVSAEPGEAILNDRLYLNDGKGNFRDAGKGMIPENREANRAIAVADIDGDGDNDLFTGGRHIPGRWPETPRSFLLENRNGKLVDVTNNRAPGLSSIGMVTDAVFGDINRDSKPDLIVSLEWGPVSVWMNTGDTFENRTAQLGLAGKSGWWNTVEVADVNYDGLPDILAGNLGLNTKYHATAEEPTTLFAGTFNNDGEQHLVEAQYESGVLYPVRGLSKLRYSFPRQTRRFRTFDDYAQATLVDIFGEESLANARKLEATELASGIYIQQSDGTFIFKPLPREAQLSPIHTFAVFDFNADGIQDLFLAGNQFGPEPTTGRFDGSLGLLLENDGHGAFKSVWPAHSGISIPGEARASVLLESESGPGLLVARTNGPLMLFRPAGK